MIVYFSGTGNSRYCAQMIAAKTNDTLLNTHNYIKDEIAPTLISSQPWVFVCPTYAWQIPRIFRKFLRSGCFSGAKDAYFVMTCGSEIGNPGKQLSALCQEIGLHYRGILQVVMPENYVAMFPVPDEKESAKIITAATPVLQQGINAILANEDFPPHPTGFADRLKSSLVNAAFYPLCVSANKFRTTDACIHCGKCTELCPLNNITLENNTPRWGRNCTHCMACICGCPAEAIEYGSISKDKPRYQCKDYKEK